jgi:cell division protein FtsL
MKPYLSLLLILLVGCLPIKSSAQTPDSTKPASAAAVGTPPKVDATEKTPANTGIKETEQKLSTSEKLIAFSPLIIYFLITFLVFIKLKKDGVTLKELLLDKDMLVAIKEEQVREAEADVKKLKELNETVKIMANKGLSPENTTLTTSLETLAAKASNKSEASKAESEQKSVSRLLAFISGLVSVGLASVITTFYLWQSFEGNTKVELNGLLTALLTLGIGVVPYAFNKVASALK